MALDGCSVYLYPAPFPVYTDKTYTRSQRHHAKIPRVREAEQRRRSDHYFQIKKCQTAEHLVFVLCRHRRSLQPIRFVQFRHFQSWFSRLYYPASYHAKFLQFFCRTKFTLVSKCSVLLFALYVILIFSSCVVDAKVCFTLHVRPYWRHLLTHLYDEAMFCAVSRRSNWCFIVCSVCINCPRMKSSWWLFWVLIWVPI